MPADTPRTTPDEEPIVATAVLTLVHVPPTAPSVNIMVDPTHTCVGPEITVGVVLTFTVAVT